MARSRLNVENRIELATKRIEDGCENGLKEIGKLMVDLIRNAAPRGSNTRYYHVGHEASGERKRIKSGGGGLRKSIWYWYRRQEKDLLIGSKSFYAPMLEFGTSKQAPHPFLMPVMRENVELIQKLIALSLRNGLR